MSDRLALLEQFFKDVCDLVVTHNILNDTAVVYPSKLSLALEKIDKYWWKTNE